METDVTGLLPRDVGRLVVVLPSWVGDAVMSTPLLRGLREHAPDARIVGIMQQGLDEVLAGTPWLDELVPCIVKSALGVMRLRNVIRSHRPDAVLLLPNSFRVALATALAGVPMRIGYDRDGRGRLLTHRVEVPRADRPTPTIEYYAALARATLGVDSIDPTMHLVVSESDEADAARLLGELPRPYLLLNPGANHPAKRWPASRFAQVANALATSHGFSIVVSGAPAEREITQAVTNALDGDTPVVDLARRGVGLGGLKAIIREATLMISNDTGPRHMAAALGVPVVTLFGPTDHRWTSLPDTQERIVLAEPFLPEESIADNHAARCHIGRISVPDVIAAANDLLAESR